MKDTAAANRDEVLLHEDRRPNRGAGVLQARPNDITLRRNILTIALRELRAYFDSLVAYVVIGGSLLGLGVYFFFFQSGGFWQVDRASMSRMFEFLPWALSVLVIPLVTMRALAEEKRSGTIELLITLPVTDADVILGKYFAALGMTSILLLATLTYPLAIFVWPWHLGALDWGPVWAGYLGLFLFSSAGIAVGMLFSSITESQIIAFFLTAGVLLFLTIIHGLVEALHGSVGDAIAFVSFQSRYLPFARGLIDTRAIVYFLSVTILCLLSAFRSLESRKWS
jgi:ABC-2 type transport system permease protein